jgi:hypothetical protein
MKYCVRLLLSVLAISLPASATVTVTTPKAGTTVTSPVQYVASATATTCAKGVASMGIYVDNKLIYVVDAKTMNHSITLAAGAEHTVVEEWDHCGKATYTTINLTVAAATTKTAVTVTATPASIAPGASSSIQVVATNATTVTLAGSDGSSYTLGATGGTETVTPTATTTYTATATGASSTATAQATVTVSTKTLTAIAVTPNPASFATGDNQQFTATATYSDSSTANVTSSATWSAANSAVATVNSSGLATGVATGSTTITATLSNITGSATAAVTAAEGTGVNITTWHADNNRSGLNPHETTLTPSNVSASTFGKLFTYAVDGYAYATPLIVSNLTVNGAVHNVVFVATEKDSVYAFDADKYGAGTPLWKTSVLESGETPSTTGVIKPYQGITSTPAIDLSTNTIYVVSTISKSGSNFFRLSALDITTGAQKFGGPVTIKASVKATNSDSVNGVETLTTSCTQRAALLLDYNSLYIGFGSCHSGWLLSYNATTLAQTGVFNSSPNLNGEGAYASAGGVWMGAGGPVSDGKGSVYITTGNGPWDGKTAFADSIIRFNSTLTREDYFTPQDFQFMDCNDADLASGGLMLIPGTTEVIAGGKMGKLYLVNTTNMGKEQSGDAGATQTIEWGANLISPYSASCKDSAGTHTATVNSFEIFGTSAYFNGSVYLGVTPTAASVPSGIRQFTYSGGKLAAGSYTSQYTKENTRGTTPFLSSNGDADGILWMIDQGLPLGNSSGSTTTATLRAYNAANVTEELYNSSANSADVPGYGIKFSSPVVANGKVYISTGHDLTTASNPAGEITVYGLN